MSKAVAEAGLRVARPLDPATFGPKDDLFKPNVLKKVLKKVKRRRVRWVHGAPSCKSFSRARRPNARLRSKWFPNGLPDKVSHPLVVHGNMAAKTMLRIAKAQHRAGGYWSIEQPKVLLWLTRGAVAIASLPGVR